MLKINSIIESSEYTMAQIFLFIETLIQQV